MKPEHIKIIGSTIFWGFTVLYWMIVFIPKDAPIDNAEILNIKTTFLSFIILGILLIISAWRIEKMENKKQKGSYGET